MAAFSRLQLAAALIEYDNDPASPDQPYRSAQESAIFAHVRQANTGVRAPARRSTDYLGVDLPSDHGRSPSPRDPYVRAQSSLSGMLVNPFGGTVEDDMDGGEEPHPAEPEPELEVDLASWGLDGFIPKDKDKARVKKKGKGKAREVEFPNPHDQRARAQSIDLGRFGAGGAFLDSARTPSSDNRIHARAQSVSAALELGRGASPLPIVAQRPMSSHAAIQSLPVTPPLHSVPFPSQSVRSVSPGPQLEASSPRRSHGRTYSTASWGSKAMLNDIQESERNPFELDAPPPERTSRFDPKAARSRTASIGSMGSRALLDDFADDGENGTSLRPASPSQSTRLDTKARSRVMSTASMGSRMMLDDGMSVMTGAPYRQERPMSTLEMLRPKVLVMPSPLQGQPEAKPAPPSYTVRDGFQLTLSSDGTPLPPGVRASGSSTNLLQPSASVPIASNSFIPNPRSTLTASQLLFRNQLMVDGQRDVAYADIDRGLQRATEDGQQIFMPEDEEPVHPVSVVVDELVAKPAGKLFGKSLVDELEERKATMRSKQRVFYGDSRPSMMSRAQTRSSTLIDPATLTQRPGAPDGALERRNSYGPKPLLNIEDGPLPPPRRPGLGQTGSSRSVFGVDTLWEKEMAKLKEIEALEAAARKEEEAMEQAAAVKRGKKKGKGKAVDVSPLPGTSSSMPLSDSPLPSPSAEPRVSIAPPVLPDIPRNITRGPPPPAVEDESDSGSDSTDDSARKADAPQWFAGASDDEHGGGPVRTTGTGPRYPYGRGLPMPQPADDDSEEDVPLVATVSRAMQRATRLGLQPGGGDDSDEDKPLSRVLQKKKSTAGTLDIDFDKAISPSSPGPQLASPGAINSDDEDDKPLGLRASRVLPPSSAAGGDGSDDEDEKPLGLHPQQQMRSMYASQQQQQQQMQFAQQMAMQQQMQAQAAHASMMFSNPSMMGSGFFAPQPTPGMMAAPMMVPMMPPPATGSPPPAQDPAKFNRVDQWRRGVPVDGS